LRETEIVTETVREHEWGGEAGCREPYGLGALSQDPRIMTSA